MPTKDLYDKLICFVSQVYNKLQKLFLCCHISEQFLLLKNLGKIDYPVKEWCDEIVSNFIWVSI